MDVPRPAVSNTAAQPVWVVDPDGVFKSANPAAITPLGYDSADELLGRHRHETIHYARPGGTPYPPADCPMRIPPNHGPDGRARSGLVLQARRLDPCRLVSGTAPRGPASSGARVAACGAVIIATRRPGAGGT